MKRKKKNMKNNKVAVKTRKSRQGRGSSIKSGKALFKKRKIRKPFVKKARNGILKRKKRIKKSAKKNPQSGKIKHGIKLIKKPIFFKNAKKHTIKRIALKK